MGDLDNDGRLDAVVTTNDGPLYVLHNETPGDRHWLILNLIGHRSNRHAIGAEIVFDRQRHAGHRFGFAPALQLIVQGPGLRQQAAAK